MTSQKTIGGVLFFMAVTTFCMAFVVSRIEEVISFGVSGSFILVAGALLFRGVRAWPIFLILSASIYCYLVAKASTSMLLHGSFLEWFNTHRYFVSDPSIRWVDKAALVYFQGLLPLLLLASSAFGTLVPLLNRSGMFTSNPALKRDAPAARPLPPRWAS